MDTAAAFYHCFCAGAWQAPTHEFFAALRKSTFNGPVFVGFVGSPAQRWNAQRMLVRQCVKFRYVHAGDGWEQVTLNAVHTYVHGEGSGDGIVLYGHSKGAAFPTEWNAMWRRSMTHRLLDDWDAVVKYLESGVDAVGSHWLTPEEWGEGPREVGLPIFGGNFWAARNDFLRLLPPPAMGTRHDAEAWLASGPRRPRVVDLLHGWPSPQLCALQ